MPGLTLKKCVYSRFLEFQEYLKEVKLSFFIICKSDFVKAEFIFNTKFFTKAYIFRFHLLAAF